MEANQYDYKLEFFHGQNLVGLLTESQQLVPGRWGYMPCRGPGHYDLSTALRNGSDGEWCSIARDGGVVRFLVARIPEYGALEVIKVSNT